MKPTRWLLALPVLAAALSGPARGATIRDEAGMFQSDAIARARAKLESIEAKTRVPVTIETVESLGGQAIDDAALEGARRSGRRGVFILIAEQEHSLRVYNSNDLSRNFGRSERDAIQSAFSGQFKAGKFDAGLLAGVEALEGVLSGVKAGGTPAPAGRPNARVANPGRGQTGLGSLLMIGLVIMAVLLGIRLLGNLFGGNRGGYGGQGRPGYGQGGYGQPGYGGGGGGGFFSGLFGGLGGAIAGNWLYDQFRGGHHGSQPTGYDQSAGATDPHGTDPDRGGGWTGGDAGGGDWGGGDAGGDWGGGGDLGGGGGDWGGGGGDGGSW